MIIRSHSVIVKLCYNINIIGLEVNSDEAGMQQ